MKSHEIGRHTLVYGDDDVSLLIYRGPISFDEMKAILDTEDLSKVPDTVLLICDVTEAGRISAEARRLGATNPKLAKRYLTAYVGATFGYRVLIDMWTRATNLLQGFKYIVGFYDNHDDARKWLLAQRAAFEKQT